MNSVGLAAIEVSDEDMPMRVLNAQSVIHDGGVDPQKNKEAITRKSISGVARRTRRMRRRRRERLHRLDMLLNKLKYPIIEPDTLDKPFEEWHVRSELASRYIEDDALRRENISIAVRHIARHRGWRNPYRQVDSLLNDNPYSKQYAELREKAQLYVGAVDGGSLTPAQLVVAMLDAGYAEAPRLRWRTGSKKPDAEGYLPVRLMQEDNANELKQIFTVQRIPRDEWVPLFRSVFYAVSPKGSAEQRVGKDPLAPSQPRALKASLAFQQYRIANVITNLRIKDGSADPRKLTVEEKQSIFDQLISLSSEDITWSDLCDFMEIKRSQLKGVGTLTEDGDERISSRPPRMTSPQRIYSADKKIRKPLVAWWKNASEDEQEAMIRLLSNTVDIDNVREDVAYAAAIDFINGLDDEALTKLDSIDLPSGRAAYSVDTLQKLTHQMLTTGDDLHEARKTLFHVTDTWRPPAAPIGEPLGNPAVDRVLKIVNRYLVNCQRRWGNPVSVNIEHVRSSFSSVAFARKDKREYEKNNERRSVFRDSLAEQLRTDEKRETVRESDLRRLEAIQRQNGQCLYCGRTITFSTCEMDHIVPRKGVGSTNTRTNLAAVCAECNRMKTNIPFAVWARTEDARQRGVSLAEAKKRVVMFTFNPKSYAPREVKAFKQAVIARLTQTEDDAAIDNRSIESVAWMADELHRRIDWYFNSRKYLNSVSAADDLDGNKGETAVSVFQGRVTAAARRAAGIEGKIHFIGQQAKTRLDRRHHAVDASVIALMNVGAAQTLMERESLRESQRLVGRLMPGERSWKEYPYEGTTRYGSFHRWLDGMNGLLDLLNDALDGDRIVVMQPQRYTLGNSIAHDATIHPLEKVTLGSAMEVELIKRASIPALWCALTRLPGFDEKTGLPEDANRSICVNGLHYGADDEVGFFASTAAQIAVQQGSAEIGSAIHHARVYRCWKTGAKGVRKYFYGMIRVFQADLLHARTEDLFTVPLLPQSISMRYGEARVVQAVQSGNAQYLGSLVVGDEIEMDFSESDAGGQIGEYLQFFSQLNGGDIAGTHWVVDGFFSNSRLRLHPRYIASEGMSKSFADLSVPDGVQKIVAGQGWLPSVNVVAETAIRTVRRNAFGELRFSAKSHMPCSWRWKHE
ncbi:restriction endonuclease [Bifidobacterium scaligerum]|uniref:Restriction endonuclease n=1 Tax=Bifidobacterium scaligerum TaxID=2052656 RepID=A0A2M9HRX4_9BIFI|nr:restriction endonuclease [Bifidobacterium scaligerum]